MTNFLVCCLGHDLKMMLLHDLKTNFWSRFNLAPNSRPLYIKVTLQLNWIRPVSILLWDVSWKLWIIGIKNVKILEIVFSRHFEELVVWFCFFITYRCSKISDKKAKSYYWVVKCNYINSRHTSMGLYVWMLKWVYELLTELFDWLILIDT